MQPFVLVSRGRSSRGRPHHVEEAIPLEKFKVTVDLGPEVGSHLRDVMRAFGVSDEEIAQLGGYEPQQLTQLHKDNGPPVSGTFVLACSERIGIDPYVLIGGRTFERKPKPLSAFDPRPKLPKFLVKGDKKLGAEYARLCRALTAAGMPAAVNGYDLHLVESGKQPVAVPDLCNIVRRARSCGDAEQWASLVRLADTLPTCGQPNQIAASAAVTTETQSREITMDAQTTEGSYAQEFTHSGIGSKLAAAIDATVGEGWWAKHATGLDINQVADGDVVVPLDVLKKFLAEVDLAYSMDRYQQDIRDIRAFVEEQSEAKNGDESVNGAAIGEEVGETDESEVATESSVEEDSGTEVSTDAADEPEAPEGGDAMGAHQSDVPQTEDQVEAGRELLKDYDPYDRTGVRPKAIRQMKKLWQFLEVTQREFLDGVPDGTTTLFGGQKAIQPEHLIGIVEKYHDDLPWLSVAWLLSEDDVQEESESDAADAGPDEDVPNTVVKKWAGRKSRTDPRELVKGFGETIDPDDPGGDMAGLLADVPEGNRSGQMPSVRMQRSPVRQQGKPVAAGAGRDSTFWHDRLVDLNEAGELDPVISRRLINMLAGREEANYLELYLEQHREELQNIAEHIGEVEQDELWGAIGRMTLRGFLDLFGKKTEG